LDAEIATSKEEHAQRLTRYEKWETDPDLEDTSTARLIDQRERAKQSLTPTLIVRVTEMETVVEGPASEVLANVDEASISEARLGVTMGTGSTGPPNRRIDVTFSKSEGVTLDVFDSPLKVAGHTALIDAELRKGVPNWSFLRMRWMWLPYGIPLLVLAWSIGVRLVP
jgi:hypothetical protein